MKLCTLAIKYPQKTIDERGYPEPCDGVTKRERRVLLYNMHVAASAERRRREDEPRTRRATGTVVGASKEVYI